jgi:hypothetical protein
MARKSEMRFFNTNGPMEQDIHISSGGADFASDTPSSPIRSRWAGKSEYRSLDADT